MSPKDKKTLRQELIAKRAEQNQNSARTKSIQAQQILLAEDVWKNASTVALYMSIWGEVDTSLLLESAWQDKKTVLLPRCDPRQASIMNFFVCHSLNDLEPGSFNILEPKEHTKIWEDKIDLLIAPAVGFAYNGHRLGFGNGYYDCFLSRGLHNMSLGLVFAWQIFKNLPPNAWDEWDMRVNGIISEDGMLWV